MPDSEPAGSSVRPKTAMAESQNQNTNGGNGQSESANQNSARAGTSGIPVQGAGPSNASATPSKAMVKYGELVILGYNGQLPQGDLSAKRLFTSKQ